MDKYVLIACCKTKAKEKSRVSDLYISNLFKKSLAYAKSLTPKKIFVLSAKYELLELDDEISPYDETLKGKKKNERIIWAENVLKKLSNISNLENDEYIILAGEIYREFLIPKIKNYKIPLKGISLLKQIQWLKERINE